MLTSCLLQDAYIYPMYTLVWIILWKFCYLHLVAMETLSCRGQISEKDEDLFVQNSHSTFSFQPLEHLAITGCIWSTPASPAPSMCGGHAFLLLFPPNPYNVLQIAGINMVLRESPIVYVSFHNHRLPRKQFYQVVWNMWYFKKFHFFNGLPITYLYLLDLLSGSPFS